MKTLTFLFGICFVIQGCSNSSTTEVEVEPYEIQDPPEPSDLWKIDKRTSPSFELNSREPFELEFGSGSAIFALDSLRIQSNGNIILFRKRARGNGKEQMDVWQTAKLELTKEEIDKLFQMITNNKLLDFESAYHAAVADGTQWILWIKQGDKEGAFFFNNFFPPGILKFATDIDLMLSGTGARMITWNRCSQREGEGQQRQLWNRIRKKDRSGTK